MIAWDGRHQGTHVPRSPITVFSIPRDLISVQQSPATSIAGLFICILDPEDGRTELVLAVPGEVWGLNSETGKLSWFVETELTGNISPSPSMVGQSIFVFGGYRSAGSYRIRSGGKGDVTKSDIDWHSRNSASVARYRHVTIEHGSDRRRKLAQHHRHDDVGTGLFWAAKTSRHATCSPCTPRSSASFCRKAQRLSQI